MEAAMKLDKDGRPAISEAQVIRAIRDLLEPRWMMIQTNASDLTRGGRPAHRRNTLDFVCVRRQVPQFYKCYPHVFFLEAKRRNARTCKARLAGQSETAEALRDGGHVVIQMPERHPDPVGWFIEEARKLRIL
jgi:hypothetical protein